MHTTCDLDALQSLTARYARYSRSAGGLSLVVGAVLVTLAFAVGAFVELDRPLRIALALSPFVWLAAKEALRAFYYQRQGGVAERLSAAARKRHRWMVAYLFTVSALIVGGVFWYGGTAVLRGAMLGYVLLAIALPFAAWRWFWSAGDFVMGVLLFCQAAVVLAGGHYSAAWLVYVAACAAIAAAIGLREHRDFLRLRAALGSRGAAA